MSATWLMSQLWWWWLSLECLVIKSWLALHSLQRPVSAVNPNPRFPVHFRTLSTTNDTRAEPPSWGLRPIYYFRAPYAGQNACSRQHPTRPAAMPFLAYYWLLASINERAWDSEKLGMEF